MKWFNQLLIIIYGLTALYFLYMAGMGIFVYVANKSMGHQESFLVPSRNLAIGLILGTFTWAGWRLIKNPESYKWGLLIVYLPASLALLFVLWFVVLFIGSGGKWN
jgi:hypothetical protein